MKRKDLDLVRTKDIKELEAMLIEAKNALANFLIEHAQRKLKNTRSIFNKRKEIAQISTFLSIKRSEEKLK